MEVRLGGPAIIGQAQKNGKPIRAGHLQCFFGTAYA